jgi:hypothetical protein
VTHSAGCALKRPLLAWVSLLASLTKTKVFSIDSIYVPVKRAATLNPEKVKVIAQGIMDQCSRTSEMALAFVLSEGLHRLKTIFRYLSRSVAELWHPA